MRLRALLLAPAAACAAAADPPLPVPGETVVVTATRTERPAARVPASVDALDAGRLQAAQPLVNLSESLPSLAGVVANNRQNYAQDLQVSVRGFGARSTFGVRGVRIVVDGIPATLPDGQGQVSHIDLASAARLEVLRGPFSVLYGNAAGGVIDVVTAPGTPQPSASLLLGAGSDGLRRFAIDAAGTVGGVAARVAGGHFATSGYRDHSAATRDNLNAKAAFTLPSGTAVTLVANAMDLPEAQDPLGLTRAQWERDPRSVDPSAIQFDTRKSVDQAQGGAVLEHGLDAGLAARLSAYAGSRGTRQYQAIPVAAQSSPLHPGGVIDLSRGYGGVDARLRWDGRLAGGPVTVVGGASRDRLEEDRRGYQNFVGTRTGVLGTLRRDESNRAVESGVYLQGEWEAGEAWRVLAGVRRSKVEVDSRDLYVTAANPDDSGAVSFSATTPVVGASVRLAPRLDAYASAGRGFETPTLNELAYRSDGATGLNTALEPARSDHLEAGLKWTDAGGWRATAAVFEVRTDDEIVVQANTGGRTTFRNGGATRRRGVELQASRDWRGFGVSLSAAWLDAVYRDGFLTCTATPCATPTVRIPAGNRIPGVPARTAWGELRWRPFAPLEAAIEARYAGNVMVNDLNTDAAPAHAVVSLRVATRWRWGAWQARPFLRVDNLFDRRYAGSVIVNEGNQRYFEPAPGRTWFAGVSVALAD